MNCPHCKKPIKLTPHDAAQIMGSVKKPSEKLKSAARENGKKGGRPRKIDQSKI